MRTDGRIVSLRRFGDEYHAAFAAAVNCRSSCTDMSGAQTALASLAACGHEMLIEEELANRSAQVPGQSAVLSRLELLAWRGIDDEQDRFAQSMTIGDQRGAADAVDDATAFVALIGVLREVPATDGSVP